MEIIINNKVHIVEPDLTIRDILIKEGFQSNVAIWVNDHKLLQRDYPTYQLKQGDRLTIIRPLVGG